MSVQVRRRLLLGFLVFVGAATATTPAFAAEDDSRPSEDSLFGAPAEDPTPREEPAGSPGSPREERDERALMTPSEGKPGDGNAFTEGRVEEDPLKIGGQFYLRALSRLEHPLPARESPFSFPALIDGYFDARPNDRVRAMLVTRLSYDPALDPSRVTPLGLPSSSAGASAGGNPRVDLDQLWIRTDIARKVFLTAGRQHVKWGTGRFWNPTDFLSPQRRDPLAVFDARLGSNMVKLHLPVESLGWNFYSIALIDSFGPSDTVGKLGAAARAEFVFGNTEIGLDAVARRGQLPRYGVDVSAGVGPFDVYAEAALRRGSDVPAWRLRSEAERPSNFNGLFEPSAFDTIFEQFQPSGLNVSATTGLTYTFHYSDADTATVGLEYFYNRFGYDHPAVLVPLLLSGSFRPFYAGRHYVGAYALLPAPGSWENTSIVLSNLMNVSDPSAVARLDVSWRVHSYLTIESYVQGHYGVPGELRLGATVPDRVDNRGTPDDVSDDVSQPGFVLPYPLLEMGLGLRVNL